MQYVTRWLSAIQAMEWLSVAWLTLYVCCRGRSKHLIYII